MKKIAVSVTPTAEIITVQCKDCGCKFFFIMPMNKQGMIRCRGCPHKIQIKDLEDAISETTV